ncbi:hypothetical protein AMTR_s00125p00020290 [Amborella trichopoda]|uniref:Uncharacterized protein n=1 Tax=Amborella trichopoda TaxID=13333 RepID=W1NR57_AMBTC|nr:hypothetical protein AMTR_s00125p00020290 [Amborella trichopoda]
MGAQGSRPQQGFRWGKNNRGEDGAIEEEEGSYSRVGAWPQVRRQWRKRREEGKQKRAKEWVGEKIEAELTACSYRQ